MKRDIEVTGNARGKLKGKWGPGPVRRCNCEKQNPKGGGGRSVWEKASGWPHMIVGMETWSQDPKQSGCPGWAWGRDTHIEEMQKP